MDPVQSSSSLTFFIHRGTHPGSASRAFLTHLTIQKSLDSSGQALLIYPLSLVPLFCGSILVLKLAASRLHCFRLSNNRLDTNPTHRGTTIIKYTTLTTTTDNSTTDTRQFDNTPTVTTLTIPTIRQHIDQLTSMAPQIIPRQGTEQVLPSWLTYSPIIVPTGTSYTILRLPLTYYGPSVSSGAYLNIFVFTSCW